MTIACLELKVKVIGHNAIGVALSEDSSIYPLCTNANTTPVIPMPEDRNQTRKWPTTSVM